MTIHFSQAEREAATKLIDLGLAEDFQGVGDLTSSSVVDASATAEIRVVARRNGVLAGAPIAEMVFNRIDPSVIWRTRIADCTQLTPGAVVATVSGPVRSLLTGERTALNFLTHLSGIATLTRQFVDAVAGTRAQILDTRKTLPGYRVLQKYAVRAGGGTNHRMGLYDGILIKDNHLAYRGSADVSNRIAEAVTAARSSAPTGIPIEIEVDSLDQLRQALAVSPDIVLLDNMNPEQLRDAIAIRDKVASQTQLEASGGVTLANVAEIAATGVDRISIGALTHSAPALDLAFDF